MGMPPKPVTPLSIVEQPANVTVPLGQAASFKVIALGPTAISYQWQENGTAIAGATSAAYSFPSVTASDTGAILSVVVSDGTSSITSDQATLSVGPRSPMAGDLRFQQVGSPGAQGSLTSLVSIGFATGLFDEISNSIVSPLQLGEGLCVSGVQFDCAWNIVFYSAPSSLAVNAGFASGNLDQFAPDLKATSVDTVVTTMDFESANDAFALGYLQESGMTFQAQNETASLSALQAATNADGAAGRVVTAITFNASGDAQFLSYSWSQDTSNVYETETETASLENIGTAATTLANDGYIITAFGGNPQNGYVMVGTRVKGDSIRRPILVFPPTDSSTPTTGYAIVARADSLPSPDNPNGLYIFVYQQ